MWDSLRGYVNLASGLTEVTARKAVETATTLLTSGVDEIPYAVTESVTGVAEDMARMTTAQRDALTSLVRSEVDRAVGRLGFVREDELAALRRRVTRLEEQVVSVGVVPAAVALGVNVDASANSATAPEAGSQATAAQPTPAKKTAVKKTAVKKTAVKKTAVKKTAVKSSTLKSSGPSGSSTAVGRDAEATAKKTAVKKPVAKKSAAQSTPTAKRPASKSVGATSVTRASGDEAGAARRPSAGSRTLASGR